MCFSYIIFLGKKKSTIKRFLFYKQCKFIRIISEGGLVVVSQGHRYNILVTKMMCVSSQDSNMVNASTSSS